VDVADSLAADGSDSSGRVVHSLFISGSVEAQQKAAELAVAWDAGNTVKP
jgi:hypothetical protein